MLNRTLVVCLLAVILASCSNDQKQIDTSWRAYNYARDNGDFVTAVSALNTILAIDPFQNNVKDSLARIYYKAQMFRAAKNVAQELLNGEGAHMDMNLIAAESSNNLGLVEESLDYFNKWLEVNPSDIGVRYNYAVNLFNLKRADEAIPHLKEIINNPESRKLGKNFGTDAANGNAVSYYGAALNVMGFIELQKNNLKDSETFFKESLKSDPHFNLARNNLQALYDLGKKK
ncbi:MAG: tetratricopeptide repeat protein [Flavobacteriales bacterium]|nr:tetratricopeptide repeat protein [Flavobacteriales bacterium]